MDRVCTETEALLAILEKTRRRHFNMLWLPDRTVTIRHNETGYYEVSLLDTYALRSDRVTDLRVEKTACFSEVPAAVCRVRTIEKSVDAFVFLNEKIGIDLYRWILVEADTLEARRPLGEPLDLVYRVKS